MKMNLSVCLCPGTSGHMDVSAFIYLFNKCLGSTYYGSGSVLSVENTLFGSLTKQTSPRSPEAGILVREVKTPRKQMRTFQSAKFYEGNTEDSAMESGRGRGCCR